MSGWLDRRYGVVLIATLAALAGAGASAAGPTETVLHGFASNPNTGGSFDGYSPSGGVVLGSGGVVYGTTLQGGHGAAPCPYGVAGCGEVFALTAPSAGTPPTTLNVLHRFGGGWDGGFPYAGVVEGAGGVLYGTTGLGGYGGGGVVFALTPPATGKLPTVFTLLHSFTDKGGDGATPVASVTLGGDGILYGTTEVGGATALCQQGGCGVVFKLTRPANGKAPWVETILHTFQGGVDGTNPRGNVLLGAGGVLYGTTSTGGGSSNCAGTPPGCGVVFQLAPPTKANPAWTATTLYAFTGGRAGSYPEAGVIQDKDGALYGTTTGGGDLAACGNGAGCGGVFKLTRPASGKAPWTATVLHSFKGATSGDGEAPLGAVVLSKSGVLYGTTANGGNPHYNCGTVYKLTPPSAGEPPTTLTVLHDFTCGADGEEPNAGLFLAASGDLYGATPNDTVKCDCGVGVVFKMTP